MGSLIWQRRRELKAESKEREEVARATARLLLADLLQATNRLRLADKSGEYWSGRFALSLESWREQRAVSRGT